MADDAGFLGRGWAYPIELGPDGSFLLAERNDDIRQAVEIILRTELGERMMRPEFGAGMHDKVFAGLDAATLGHYRSAITRALRLHEPRIEAIEVEIDAPDPLGSRLVITVGWTVRLTNRRDNLVYDYYLEREG
jgi:phage baseplate assembly protein W